MEAEQLPLLLPVHGNVRLQFLKTEAVRVVPVQDALHDGRGQNVEPQDAGQCLCS